MSVFRGPAFPPSAASTVTPAPGLAPAPRRPSGRMPSQGGIAVKAEGLRALESDAAAAPPPRAPDAPAAATRKVVGTDPRAVHAAIYDAPLPARRLPALRSALVDPAVEPLSPSRLPAPPAVLDALQDARRVLVVSHTPPDGDCVGSSLGLSRALRALGKEAVAVVDAPLSGRLRTVAGGELLRADEALARGPYDLVVLVDVAQPDRIGGAAAALGQAAHVVVLDHHYVEPSSDSLGLGAGIGLSSWVLPGLESSSLQVASCVDALASRMGVELTTDARAEVMRPLATGLYTDTDGFKLPGAGRDALRMMKHLCGQLAATPLAGLDVIERDLRYQLPRAAARALAEGVHEHQRAHPRATVLRAPHAALTNALQAAQAADPHATPDDVRGLVLDRLDQAAAQDGLAVLLLEEEGRVRVSVRSREPGAAAKLVEDAFPGCGGGKPHAAAASVTGDLDTVEARLDAFFEQQRDAQLLRLGVNPGRR